jgi:acyl carrier protein
VLQGTLFDDTDSCSVKQGSRKQVGMWSLVEPRVRRLVAEHLGVTEEELSPELSLVDDLAADSLDFAELALAVEEELDLAVPEQMLDGVRTYGDLVEAAITLARARLKSEAPNVPVVARVHRPAHGSEGMLERAGLLTPYFAETLADDVLRSGPDAHLEVTVPAPAEEQAVRYVRTAFAWLADRGVQVAVQREGQGGPGCQSAA